MSAHILKKHYFSLVELIVDNEVYSLYQLPVMLLRYMLEHKATKLKDSLVVDQENLRMCIFPPDFDRSKIDQLEDA